MDNFLWKHKEGKINKKLNKLLQKKLRKSQVILIPPKTSVSDHFTYQFISSFKPPKNMSVILKILDHT